MTDTITLSRNLANEVLEFLRFSAVKHPVIDELAAALAAPQPEPQPVKQALIAAAPALYEALQSMLAIHTEPAGFVGKYGKKLTEFVEAQEVKVNAATAKARAALALVGGGE